MVDKNNLVAKVRQSPPIDTSTTYDLSNVKDKTVVITGGASGFGAGLCIKWAEHGANVIIADINTDKGNQLISELRKSTGNENLHFVYCDVTDWQSQVDLFKKAVKLSPHGGIDTVLANAGIIEAGTPLERPVGLDADEPPKPVFKTLDVNLIGVLYTTHLALFYLPRNPDSKPANLETSPTQSMRDRHLLLTGSTASLNLVSGAPLYGVSKHGVLGLFRNLRGTSFVHGVRVNMICPYFIDTPLLPPSVHRLLAGGAMGEIEDVVDAASRFVADQSIAGRSLVISGKTHVEQKEDGQWEYVGRETAKSEEKAVWECYADDFEECEVFVRNMISILNSATRARGWTGWLGDHLAATASTFKSLVGLRK
ncbi:MAG: 40S ribosomal protein mrp2, mitochondrial [Chaenotheca gracillima]|nr:MAG: 40S ribosomal protein mrp2, mitochondrial [Chaenotheca gracillima]